MVLAALVAVAVLAGCAVGPSEKVDSVAWEEPAWFAQLRQDREEFQLRLVDCYQSQGVAATPSLCGGTADLPTMPYPSPPGAWEHLMDAIGFCTEKIGIFSWGTLPVDHQAYDRMIESRACLVTHGFYVPEPPTAEVWIESDAVWVPHGEAWDNRSMMDARSGAEFWSDMNTACPQPGPHFFTIAGLQ